MKKKVLKMDKFIANGEGLSAKVMSSITGGVNSQTTGDTDRTDNGRDIGDPYTTFERDYIYSK
jgi:hypothetical protein